MNTRKIHIPSRFHVCQSEQSRRGCSRLPPSPLEPLPIPRTASASSFSEIPRFFLFVIYIYIWCLYIWLENDGDWEREVTSWTVKRRKARKTKPMSALSHLHCMHAKESHYWSYILMLWFPFIWHRNVGNWYIYIYNLVSELEDGFQNVDDVSMGGEMFQSKKTPELLEADDDRGASHESGDGGMR